MPTGYTRTATMSSEPFAPSRRSLLAGLAAALSAPLVVRAESLMQIKGIVQPWPRNHRWIAAYNIATDKIIMRADTLFGGSMLSAFPIDQQFHAPRSPDYHYHGLWVPNEKGRRILDRVNKPALDALYQSFDTTVLGPLNSVQQRYVELISPAEILRDQSLWERRGDNAHLYEREDV